MAKKFDVLGLGATAVDELLFVESYPPPDGKAKVLRHERHCGGLAATALVAASRLGGRCAYAGVLGHDELSNFVLARLGQEGIEVSCAPRVRVAPPIHSHIVVDERRGTRNIFYDMQHSVGAPLRPPASLLQASRVLLVDNFGVRGMIRAATLAKRIGIPVVADFESDSDPDFNDLLAKAGHLIVPLDFASKLTGQVSPRNAVCKLGGSSREVTVVTEGKKGCWYLARGMKEPRHQPAFKVPVVDTTGCGDVFHGAYAFGLARGLPIEERIRLASAAAALKASRPGGQAGIPSLPMVRRFMAG